jgi:hypothetical protein
MDVTTLKARCRRFPGATQVRSALMDLVEASYRRALGALSQARQRAIAGAAASAHPKEPHAP